MKKKVVCIIPARLNSTRFPKKILSLIHSKTMLEHVFEAASKCPQFDEIYFAIDSPITAEAIKKFGGKFYMTSTSCSNGTNRLIELMKISKIKADIWVNWQADEPFIQPEMIDDLLQGVEKEGSIWTLKKEILDADEVQNPSVVKVVTDKNNKALYFSRSPIPYNQTKIECKFFKHIGLYAYTTGVLNQIAAIDSSRLSQIESLEQLAFLENGLPIHVYPTQYETLGIDTPNDLHKAKVLFL